MIVNVLTSISLNQSHTANLVNITYHILNTPIESKNTQRDLGIVLTTNLSWSDHYNSICSKAHHSLNLISQVHHIREYHHLKLLYYTLVRFHLTFCSQLWRPYFIQDIVHLERIQRKATKYILSISFLLTYVLARALRHYVFIKCIKEPLDNINQYVTIAQGTARSSRKLIHSTQYTQPPVVSILTILQGSGTLPPIDTMISPSLCSLSNKD